MLGYLSRAAAKVSTGNAQIGEIRQLGAGGRLSLERDDIADLIAAEAAHLIRRESVVDVLLLIIKIELITRILFL